jgi:thiol-disulfide isomerase/thioredoxin
MFFAVAMRRGRRALLGPGLRLWAAALLVGPLGSACYGVPASAPFASAPADWNERQVAWVPYAEGLAAGRERQLPILLIFYTDWCPHCHNYSRLFHDPELVRLSQRFVMIRVERDGSRDISRVYDIDGEYIPRTFFLTPTGAVLTDLASDSDDYRYFLDEHDPAMLMGLMESALERLGMTPIEGSGRPLGGE